jgi:hypothetical protein
MYFGTLGFAQIGLRHNAAALTYKKILRCAALSLMRTTCTAESYPTAPNTSCIDFGSSICALPLLLPPW